MGHLRPGLQRERHRERGAEIKISSYSYDTQQEPQITSLPDGGFMVAWTSYGQDGDQWGAYAQRFDALGDASAPIRVNTTIPGVQSTPGLVAQADGSGVIIVFEHDSATNVLAKRIPLPDAEHGQGDRNRQHRAAGQPYDSPRSGERLRGQAGRRQLCGDLAVQ